MYQITIVVNQIYDFNKFQFTKKNVNYSKIFLNKNLTVAVLSIILGSLSRRNFMLDDNLVSVFLQNVSEKRMTVQKITTLTPGAIIVISSLSLFKNLLRFALRLTCRANVVFSIKM